MPFEPINTDDPVGRAVPDVSRAKAGVQADNTGSRPSPGRRRPRTDYTGVTVYQVFCGATMIPSLSTAEFATDRVLAMTSSTMSLRGVKRRSNLTALEHATARLPSRLLWFEFVASSSSCGHCIHKDSPETRTFEHMKSRDCSSSRGCYPVLEFSQMHVLGGGHGRCT